MTEKQEEKAYKVYDQIVQGISILVDENTKRLTAEQEEFVRTMLMENVRFW